MRLGSDGKYLKPVFGEEEIPMFQSVTHMECFPYWYCFFVKSLPPRPWPLTINGRVAFKKRFQGMTSPFQNIESQASNPEIFVGNPDLRICVNIDVRQDPFPESSLRAMLRDVNEMFPSHPAYPKVMEVMLTMDQKIVVSVGREINLKSKANQLPGYIACCEVTYTAVEDTGLERWSDWHSRQLTDRQWPDNVPKLPLFPGMSVRGSQGTGNPKGRRNTPHFAVNVSSGVLIKDQKDQHMMTTAARIVRPGEVVGMREFFFQNRIGLVGDVVPGTDVALVRLDDAINYKNQDGTRTFTRLLGEEPDDALPWNSIASLATRWPPYTEGIIVAKSVRVVRHTATTQHRVYHWA
ncbi:uncharacterized protein FMAN_05858 [Fusarium mangiferae]|uniref:Uncharacterized protein n=1 Tax=Fusarium mangiferae TaxID=192010 RepID=A0A1L7SR53_FUSMA|nr:uncharacterized protein FMAN_05858 [Fusarium mangiferae]CVK86913.1 uncharacterized protein FMAN_05858 [Fusarium mangiferae]